MKLIFRLIPSVVFSVMCSTGLSVMCASVLHAQIKTNIYKKAPVEVAQSPEVKKKHNTSKGGVRNVTGSALGNLTSEMARAHSDDASGTIIVPNIKSGMKYTKIKPGEVVEAEVMETLIALPDMKVPARAVIKNGPLKGTIFLGEASLEPNTKRVLVDFKGVRPPGDEDVYDIDGKALDLTGAIGIEGEYNSQEAKLFSAQFFLSLVTGWTEASISRDKNAWGTYQDVPGADTQAKRAVGEATSKSAERFAEKVKSAPAYSVVRGPTLIQVMILR